MGVTQSRLTRRRRVIKRCLDVVLSVLGLVVCAPLIVTAAVAITLADVGPWWHVQWRIGRDGVPFRMWKLRTMYLDAHERLEAHLAATPHARIEWDQEFKLTRDPRILPVVGRLLRRWSLDECPQFYNVLRGDMSLVGPRALPEYHVNAFSRKFRAMRHRVRPGITGMWQVTSRGLGAVHAQEALDRLYISDMSLRLDLRILFKTIVVVASGRGAR